MFVHARPGQRRRARAVGAASLEQFCAQVGFLLPSGTRAPRDIVREDRPPENHARRILAIAAWRAAQPSKTVRAILRADDNLVGAGTEKRRQIESNQHTLSACG